MFALIVFPEQADLDQVREVRIGAIKVKGEGLGKISPDHSVDKNLADFPLPFENEL